MCRGGAGTMYPHYPGADQSEARKFMTTNHSPPLHSGAASGLRTFLANVVISAAGLELVPPLSSDLKTVFGLNFKQVEREI